MIDILKFTNIRVVADRLMQHPLLRSLQFETIIQYTLDFLNLTNFNELYLDQVTTVHVEDYRVLLPINVIRIDQVKSVDGVYFKAMSGTFSGSLENPAYKIQGNILYTNIKECDLEIAYKGLPIDEDGYPLVLDNVYFLMALEAFIKKQMFTIYFDEGKIHLNVLQQAQQDYAFRVAQLHSKMALPSVSEMQAISNMWNKMHLTTKDFYNGFEQLTNIDTYKIH